jgi:hypothetical protein
MAYDKLVDSAALDAALKASADAIRGKTGDTASIPWDADKGFAEAIAGIQAGGGGSDEEWFNDGDTHIWITLPEGRTSPMLGVCPNGTVTVDWGDGTTPDKLTGTSTSTVKWTPRHEYTDAGNYIIRLTVDGEVGFAGAQATKGGTYLLRNASGSSGPNYAYVNAITKLEFGDGLTKFSNYVFCWCASIKSSVIPNTAVGVVAGMFLGCYGLESVIISDGVKEIGMSAFYDCHSLKSVVIPDSVTSAGSDVFYNCYALTSVTIPRSFTSISSGMFRNCYALASVVIPDGVTSIGSNAFYNCYSVKFYDFSKHTVVPTLGGTNSFGTLAEDCEIRVPASLYDEWIAATNWSKFASNIVAV